MKLGLNVNAGAAPDDDEADRLHQYNGRNRHVQRELAAERRGDPLEKVHVDHEKVSKAIMSSRSSRELKETLKAQGIETRFRWRDGEIYAWSLRNEGVKEWTSGSKLTASNDFGWGKVQSQLNKNLEDRKQIRTSRKHPIRRRGLDLTRQTQQPRRIDQAATLGVNEAFRQLQELLNAAARKQHVSDDVQAKTVKKPTPAAPSPHHPNRRRPAPTQQQQRKQHRERF